jgi:hypothetical protein
VAFEGYSILCPRPVEVCRSISNPSTRKGSSFRNKAQATQTLCYSWPFTPPKLHKTEPVELNLSPWTHNLLPCTCRPTTSIFGYVQWLLFITLLELITIPTAHSMTYTNTRSRTLWTTHVTHPTRPTHFNRPRTQDTITLKCHRTHLKKLTLILFLFPLFTAPRTAH